ncbi:AEC family transporter [Bacillus solitudinis]|uniref:AEC family transporter n=1 Tax=Bacillus solitudinis TaxID=2014074 RepID=UPI000C244176|nr:AEC family transporter [Bacillus solitudinis]
MSIATIFTSVSMMALIIFFGFLIGRKIDVSLEAKQLLMIIIINVSVPAIILNGIMGTSITDQLLSDMLSIFLLSVVFNICGMGIGWAAAFLFGFKTLNARKIAILAALGNTGFIGIPLCAQIFGPTGGLLAALFDAGLDIVIFSIVVIMLQEGEKFTVKHFKSMINIPIIAIIIGILIAIIGFDPPLIVKELTARLAALASPLAMIYVGLLLPDFIAKKKKVSLKFISVPLILKLILLPIIVIVVIQAFPVNEAVTQVTLIQVSMPTFMLATVLFARYTDDEESAVFTTIYSTLLSLLTIPLVAYIAIIVLG